MQMEFTRVRAHGAAGFSEAPHARVTIDIDANGFALVEDVRRFVAAAPAMFKALQWAESFISGFEGDGMQSGVDANLAVIREIIRQAVTKGAEA